MIGYGKLYYIYLLQVLGGKSGVFRMAEPNTRVSRFGRSVTFTDVGWVILTAALTAAWLIGSAPRRRLALLLLRLGGSSVAAASALGGGSAAYSVAHAVSSQLGGCCSDGSAAEGRRYMYSPSYPITGSISMYSSVFLCSMVVCTALSHSYVVYLQLCRSIYAIGSISVSSPAMVVYPMLYRLTVATVVYRLFPQLWHISYALYPYPWCIPFPYTDIQIYTMAMGYRDVRPWVGCIGGGAAYYLNRVVCVLCCVCVSPSQPSTVFQ